MKFNRYIGLLILFLMITISSCQKQEVVTNEELFNSEEVSTRASFDVSDIDDTEFINDDEDEDNDPDGDEEKEKENNL